MKKKWLESGLMACIFLASGWSTATDDQNENNHKTSGPVAILPAPQPRQTETGESLPPGVHLPGREFKSGDGWWALSCADTCKITEARLVVASQPHPQYDGPMVPGQVLQWLPVPPANTLLMFKPFRAPANAIKLNTGPVKTYYPIPGVPIARPKTAGTMECAVNLPDGSSARLVPVMVLSNDKEKPHEDQGEAPLFLELRINDMRQTLGQFNFGIDGNFGMKPEDYLLWAGDLDGDGKLDLIIKTDFQGTNIAMFLSSLAKPSELAGEAGRFAYFPIESAGC